MQAFLAGPPDRGRGSVTRMASPAPADALANGAHQRGTYIFDPTNPEASFYLPVKDGAAAPAYSSEDALPNIRKMKASPCSWARSLSCRKHHETLSHIVVACLRPYALKQMCVCGQLWNHDSTQFDMI